MHWITSNNRRPEPQYPVQVFFGGEFCRSLGRDLKPAYAQKSSTSSELCCGLNRHVQRQSGVRARRWVFTLTQYEGVNHAARTWSWENEVKEIKSAHLRLNLCTEFVAPPASVADPGRETWSRSAEPCSEFFAGQAGQRIGEALAGRSSSKVKGIWHLRFQDIGYGWMMDGCYRYMVQILYGITDYWWLLLVKRDLVNTEVCLLLKFFVNGSADFPPSLSADGFSSKWCIGAQDDKTLKGWRMWRSPASNTKVLGKKHHLCLTTGTSSGKSLAFALPILEAGRCASCPERSQEQSKQIWISNCQVWWTCKKKSLRINWNKKQPLENHWMRHSKSNIMSLRDRHIDEIQTPKPWCSSQRRPASINMPVGGDLCFNFR